MPSIFEKSSNAATLFIIGIISFLATFYLSITVADLENNMDVFVDFFWRYCYTAIVGGLEGKNQLKIQGCWNVYGRVDHLL